MSCTLRVGGSWRARKSGEESTSCGPNSQRQHCFQDPPRFRRDFSQKTKKPRETPGGFRLRPFSRRVLASAPREGGLAYGCSSRSQWRDRGRFARPSPLPRLQNLKAQFKPRAKECQCGVGYWSRLITKKSVSGFSNWACAFRPTHANLPENPRDDIAR